MQCFRARLLTGAPGTRQPPHSLKHCSHALLHALLRPPGPSNRRHHQQSMHRTAANAKDHAAEGGAILEAAVDRTPSFGWGCFLISCPRQMVADPN